MRGGLSDNLVEDFVGSTPGLGLDTEETGNCNSKWESEESTVVVRGDNWSTKRECKKVTETGVCNELSRELLELLPVEFFHLKDLVVGEVVIVEVS